MAPAKSKFHRIAYDTKTINYDKADKTINDAVGHLMKRFRHDLKVRES